MNKDKYLKRLFDETIEFTLKSKGALVIVGPKWCGKSAYVKGRLNIFFKNPVWLFPLAL